MNLSHLRYFVKLAQVKHYTKTAELLCITQPSLSHAISQLEKELGVVLFEKGPRGTELTSFGKQFFASVNSSLNILDNGIETIKSGARGNGIIRIDYIIGRGPGKDGKEVDKIYMLEINTTPGMTATSFIPQQVRAAGMTMTEVLTEIVENQFN